MTRLARYLAPALVLCSAASASAAPAGRPAPHPPVRTAQAAAPAQSVQAPMVQAQAPAAHEAAAPGQPRKVRVVLASPYVNAATN